MNDISLLFGIIFCACLTNGSWAEASEGTEVPEKVDESNAGDTGYNSGSERPVRQKLKETSIEPASNKQSKGQPDVEKEPDGNDNDNDSDKSQKQSKEDSHSEEKQGEVEETEDSRGRKRSRDNSAEAEETRAGTPPKQAHSTDDNPADVTSPRKKRNRDQLDKSEPQEKSDGKKEDTQSEEKPREEERGTKRHRDGSQEKEQQTESSKVVPRIPLPARNFPVLILLLPIESHKKRLFKHLRSITV